MTECLSLGVSTSLFFVVVMRTQWIREDFISGHRQERPTHRRAGPVTCFALRLENFGTKQEM